MKFFNKNKLIVKSEAKGNESKFYIDYYKLNERDDFKVRLFNEIIGNDLCLAIVDTKFANKKTISEKEISDKLIDLLGNLNIEYRKIEVKVEPSITVLGAAFRMNTAEKKKEYIFGFIINSQSLMEIKHIIDSYNVHYFVSNNQSSRDEVLNRTHLYYEDEDKMPYDFKYNIFDNNTSKSMVIQCLKENSQTVSAAIESIIS